jgi:hypothetical protein
MTLYSGLQCSPRNIDPTESTQAGHRRSWVKLRLRHCEKFKTLVNHQSLARLGQQACQVRWPRRRDLSLQRPHECTGCVSDPTKTEAHIAQSIDISLRVAQSATFVHLCSRSSYAPIPYHRAILSEVSIFTPLLISPRPARLCLQHVVRESPRSLPPSNGPAS